MKQLTAKSNQGYVNVSIEDLVSTKLNQFKGWQCQAGIQNLYIDFDGKVWISNCASTPGANRVQFQGTKRWGQLGTIEEKYTFPTNGVICPMASCGCGSDIVITKWYSGTEPMHSNVRFVPFKDVTEITSVRTNYHMPKQVLWDISRRCNYDCSYCWPEVHNTTDEHKSLAVLQSAADHIIDNWASGEEVRWYFGGGEPTLNPDFEPFIEHLSSRGQWVMLVTNGSQGPSYWAKNADHYNTLIFSAHFEFMKPELFAKNYQRVVEVMLAGSKKLNDFIVKLMTKPGQLQHSIDFVDQLKEQINFDQLPPQIKSRLKFDMVPLRRLDNGSQMLDYSQDELDTIINFNSQK